MRPPTDALIVTDIQIDFCSGGALAVPEGEEVVPAANALMDEFLVVVLTQDWHTPDHASFASQHPGKRPHEVVEMPYGSQVLWPDHCVQGTRGAELHPELRTDRAQLVIRKGYHRVIDSYSTFFENDRVTPTGLTGYLRERGVEHVTLIGLATDFCVHYSAVDAAAQGFAVTVLEHACRAIDVGGSLAAAREAMRSVGVHLIDRVAR
jgi:nicotinamidase/pyrazinamidase